MKLFLASEAKNPQSFEKLKEFAGGFEGKSLAYIPTAANGDGWGSWQRSDGSWAFVQTLKSNVSLVQLEDYRDSSVIDVLKSKDIIWVAGGYCGYLMYWLKRTSLDKNLKSILETGSVYVGSSAGSMVTGQSLDVASWFISDNEPGTENLPGLGLVSFDIYPHYEESQIDEIKKLYKGHKLYLLKDGEAIIAENGEIKVFGEERIIF